MGLIDYVAIGFLCISAYVFLSLTKNEKKVSFEDFFFNSHSTKSKRFGASVAAASTSLATVVVFFITGVEQYGAFLIWCGLTYFLGQFGLLLILKKTDVKTDSLSTVADYWLNFSKCMISSRIISVLTISAFLFMLFLELFIGSQILTYYMGDDSDLVSFLCFLTLLLIVSVYVFRGGMYAVFKSDLWQYTLMLISIVAIAFVSITNALGGSGTDVNWSSLYMVDQNNELWFFLVWVTIQNLTLPFTQLSSWQRLASSESVDSAIKGLKDISIGFLVLWILPVVAMLLLKAYGWNFKDIGEFFDFLRNSDQLVIYLSYAIIFVGFSSALFSTADSALMACALSLTDNSTFRESLMRKHGQNYKKIVFLFIVALVFFESALYYLFSNQAIQAFLSVVYVIFSQLSIIAPLVGYILYKNYINEPGRFFSVYQDVIISLGLLFGWFILFYFNFYGSDYGLNEQMSIITGSLTGTFVSSLIFLFVIIAFKSAEREVVDD